MAEPIAFSKHLQKRAGLAASMLKTEPQQKLYALLTHRLEMYHKETEKSLLKAIGFGLFMGLLGVLFMLSALVIIYMLSRWLLPTSAHHGVMYLLSILIIGFCFIIKLVTEEEEIDLKRKEGVVSTWSWGRLDTILDSIANSAICFFLGMVLAAQISLIMYHETHLGLGESISFWQATVLSLDNLLHGICLDVMEMYHITLSPLEGQRSTLTTTLFLVFRLGYDALFLMWLFTLYQRHQARELFKSYPKGKQTEVEPVLRWIQESCASRQGWIRRFTDELIFLMMAEEYLRGQNEIVCHLGEQFKRLRISDEMRALFVDAETGAELIQPAPKGSQIEITFQKPPR